MSQRYAAVAYYPGDDVQPDGNVFTTVPFLRDFRLSDPQVIYRPPDDLTPLIDDIVSGNRTSLLHGTLPTITLAIEVAPCADHFHRCVSSSNPFCAFLCAPEREGLDAIAEELQRGRHVTADEEYWSEEYWRALQAEDDGVSESSSSHTAVQKTSIWLDLSYPSDESSPKKFTADDSFSPALRRGSRRATLRHKGRISGEKHHRDERMGAPNTRQLSQNHRREGIDSVVSVTRNSKVRLRYASTAGSQREQEVRAGQVRSLVGLGDHSHNQQRQQSHRERFQHKDASVEGDRRRVSQARGKVTRAPVSPMSKKCTAVYTSQVGCAPCNGSSTTVKHEAHNGVSDKKRMLTPVAQSPMGAEGRCKGSGESKLIDRAPVTDFVQKPDPKPTTLQARGTRSAVEVSGSGAHQTLCSSGCLIDNASEGGVLVIPVVVNSTIAEPTAVCCFSEPFQVTEEGPQTRASDAKKARPSCNFASPGGGFNPRTREPHTNKCAASKCCSVM
ncbi:hypothetical protein DPX39_110136000 [Trypanosoma brucei equiperdum]|uniref:Uncharacterized protein n=1 Tax=Trypanosoma brucei equiperdum TaxID=630700 RepID=A0A3L6KXC7_9TRYP|nr:hypothetical protein DPX39_110136000 [Trypanosoma brucei equiperdum]